LVLDILDCKEKVGNRGLDIAIEEDMKKYLDLASDVMNINKNNVWINHYRDFIPSASKLIS